MSNLGQLRTNSFMKLAEASGATFTDSEMNEFINREYEHIQAEMSVIDEDYFAKSATFNIVANQETYQFPQDFIKLILFEILIDGRFIGITRTQLYKKEQYKVGSSQAFINNRSGCYYYVKGDCFGIVPIRTSDLANGFRITYIPILPVLDDDASIPAFPSIYHEILEVGAVNRARMAVKEPPIDVQFYSNKLDNLLNTITPRVKNDPKQIRMIRGNY